MAPPLHRDPSTGRPPAPTPRAARPDRDPPDRIDRAGRTNGSEPAGRAGRTAPLVDLQRQAGNRAVNRLVAGAGAGTGNATGRPAVGAGPDHHPAGPATVQRVELTVDVYAERGEEMPPGVWLESDRIGRTDRWKEACRHNLLELRNDRYTRIEQRRDFYLWFYEDTAARGYHTRWALAAYIVASGMAEMASVDWTEGPSPITNDLQGLARLGNQVIFDDVLPKLRRLYLNGPVTGTAALETDAAILAEEQQLIQSLYDSLSDDTMQRLQMIADNTYTRARIGRALGMGGSVQAGPHHRGGDVPAFSGAGGLVPGGDITRPGDRWRYGMALAEHASTLPSPGPVGDMPAVGEAYGSGEAFDRLNVRPHLHQLDARLNDTDVPEDEVVTLLRSLTPAEQRELAHDGWRLRRLGQALDAAEMRRGLVDLPGVPLTEKLWLMASAESWDWDDLDYDDVRPLVLGASSEQKAALRTGYWRDRFVEICTDATIRRATVDLELPAVMQEEWVDAEL